jgi:hypothetical protein
MSKSRGATMTHVTAPHVLSALTIVLMSAPLATGDFRRDVTADDPAYRWEHSAQTSPQEGLIVHE